MDLLGSSTVLIKLSQLSQVCLLNCLEGCQHSLARKNIKIAHIKRIIITGFSLDNINGLLGLLSTISLSTAMHRIDIYGPKSLSQYIVWARKYSMTNFRYKLYLYGFKEGLAVDYLSMDSCGFFYSGSSQYSGFSLMHTEYPGVFNSANAQKHGIAFGPLYGSLKEGRNFILPDGLIVYGQDFIGGWHLGCKVVIVDHPYSSSCIVTIQNADYIMYC